MPAPTRPGEAEKEFVVHLFAYHGGVINIHQPSFRHILHVQASLKTHESQLTTERNTSPKRYEIGSSLSKSATIHDRNIYGILISRRMATVNRCSTNRCRRETLRRRDIVASSRGPPNIPAPRIYIIPVHRITFVTPVILSPKFSSE